MEDLLSQRPWLNESFFERILRRDRQNDRIRVTDLTVKSALGKGENYASEMLRVTVQFDDGSTKQSVRFVVKAALQTFLKEMVAELGLFRKEIENFVKVIPAVEELLRSIGDETVLSAKCYETNEELSYLVFEDLSVNGFANLNRIDGLRVQDFRQALKKLAKWHAATAVLLQTNPSLLAHFIGRTNFSDNPSWRTVVENGSECIADACSCLPEFQHLTPKIQAGHSSVFERFCDAAESDSIGFKVLCHGDLWSNNVMFLRNPETGDSEDALLVDFQLSSVASPLVDIIYLLISSSHNDVTEIDWEKLLQFYHQELSECLRKLAYAEPIPRLTSLHEEMLRKGTFAGLFGMFKLGMRNLNDPEGADMIRVMGRSPEDRKYREQIILKPEARRGLEFLLRFCDRKGFLDV